MATRFRRSGNTLIFSNTGSAISSGAVVPVGLIGCGIATVDIAATTGTGAVAMQGVYELPKNTSDALVQGQKVWWSGTEVINEVAEDAWFLGYADVAATSSATTGFIRLAPFSEEGPRLLTTSATADATLTAANFFGGELTLICPNSDANTITLPAIADVPKHCKLRVRKTTADAAAITLDGNASENIGGATTYALIDAQYDNASFQSDGSAWILFDSEIA